MIKTDESIMRGRRSEWAFSATVRSRISAEQIGTYQTTSSTRTEIEASTAALRGLSNTPVTKAVIAPR